MSEATYAVKVLRRQLAEDRKWLKMNEVHIGAVRQETGRQHTAEECDCIRWRKAARKRVADLEAAIAGLSR